MTQAKLYPSGELKGHPPLRTLDEAMRERIINTLEHTREWALQVVAQPPSRVAPGIARAASAVADELFAVLALLKE